MRAPQMSWLSAYLLLKDVDASIAFYTKAFGFELADLARDGDGQPMHIEFRYHGEKPVMASPEKAGVGLTPATLGVQASQWFYLYVDDVDATIARALAEGATLERAAADEFWGDRMGIIVCPNGYRWSIARWRGETIDQPAAGGEG